PLTHPSAPPTYTVRAGAAIIASLTGPYSGTAVPYGYDSSRRQTSRQDPDGLTTTRTLDYANRITSQSTAPTGGGSAVASFSLTYDAASNLTKDIQSVRGHGAPHIGTWLYTYDADNRLQPSQAPARLTAADG